MMLMLLKPGVDYCRLQGNRQYLHGTPREVFYQFLSPEKDLGSDAEEGGGKEWECRKCKWIGIDIVKKELTEDEFMKYLDEKGEDVA